MPYHGDHKPGEDAKTSRSAPPAGAGLRSVERSMAARLRAGDSGTASPPLPALGAAFVGSSCMRCNTASNVTGQRRQP